jgi:hypothetical protein
MAERQSALHRFKSVDYDSFFWLHSILPHILPHIKIRVTDGVSPSALDWIKGGGRSTKGLAGQSAGLLD